MLDAEAVRARIRAALPDAEVAVKDLTGTGDQFEARVVSPSFAGRSLRERHEAVHAALEELFRSGGLRALALEAGAPEAPKR